MENNNTLVYQGTYKSSFRPQQRLIVNEIITTPLQTSNKEFHYKIMFNGDCG